jgi:hypothetical protein
MNREHRCDPGNKSLLTFSEATSMSGFQENVGHHPLRMAGTPLP